MAVFSVNQNRHLYVVNAYSATVSENSAKGTIGGVKIVGEGADKELVFAYKGADTTMGSDRIQLKNLNHIKAIAAADMVEPLIVKKVALDPNVNGGAVVAGQDYVLRVIFRQWIGIDENYTYIKSGAVHATSAMVSDASKFYQAMADSLNNAFAREIGATKTSNPYLTFAASANGLTITEKEQAWQLGTDAQERVYFDVQPTFVYVNGTDEIWGVVTDQTPDKASAVVGTTGIGNGKKIADLEYFCMGERGDQYRNMGWPNVIKTDYLVDPSKQYNALEVHHGFRDEGVNSYRSEKDITIVAENKAVLNSLIGAINDAATAAGVDLEVDTLA